MTVTATMMTGGNNTGDGSGAGRDDGDYKDSRIATMIPSADFCLTSRVRSGGDNSQHPSNGVISTIDWVLIFRLALSLPGSALGGVTAMFNSAKYESARKGGNMHRTGGGGTRRH
jgi:hypothetical protein